MGSGRGVGGRISRSGGADEPTIASTGAEPRRKPDRMADSWRREEHERWSRIARDWSVAGIRRLGGGVGVDASWQCRSQRWSEHGLCGSGFSLCIFSDLFIVIVSLCGIRADAWIQTARKGCQQAQGTVGTIRYRCEEGSAVGQAAQEEVIIHLSNTSFERKLKYWK